MKQFFRTIMLLGIATAFCVACTKETDVTKKDSNENQQEQESQEQNQPDFPSVDDIFTITLELYDLNHVKISGHVKSEFAGYYGSALGLDFGFSPNEYLGDLLERNDGDAQRFYKYEPGEYNDSDWDYFITNLHFLPFDTTIYIRPHITYKYKPEGEYWQQEIVLYGKVMQISTLSPQKYSYGIGAIKSCFSVSDTKKVAFSQSNLMYNRNTKTWSFAESDDEWFHEFIYTRWSEWYGLFSWGTSGFNRYDEDGYYIDDYLEEDIAGTNYDWGVYNAISNGGNEPGLWRTLTSDEWSYLLSRDKEKDYKLIYNSGSRFYNDQDNLLTISTTYILPDEFELKFEEDESCWIRTGDDSQCAYLNDACDRSSIYYISSINGAICLYGTRPYAHADLDAYDVYDQGYWSSSIGNEREYENERKAVVVLYYGNVSEDRQGSSHYVRLVQDLN